MKRKAHESEEASRTISVTPRKQRTAQVVENLDDAPTNGPFDTVTPSKSRSSRGFTTAAAFANSLDENDSPARRAKNEPLFSTPKKTTKTTNDTPSKSRRADQSAKRKSAKTLLENADEEVWEGENALAERILNDGDDLLDGDAAATASAVAGQEQAQQDGLVAETPFKRGRGRPKGAKNRRSPTPEGNIPPEERYFYQNRSGPPQISNNTLGSLKLLTHEEYFDLLRNYQDPHDAEKAYLLRLHARAFPQWHFEFVEGFSICLYGWGSKRKLVTKFAEYIHLKWRPTPTIIIANGYTPKATIRTILSLLAETIMGDSLPKNLSAQPSETIDVIFSYLANHPPSAPILLFINSVDAPALRRHATQSFLARLASHPHILLLATADSPTFPLLWDSTLRSQLNFVFHDCTTYAPYTSELSVVDDVHELLGRKGHRVGGREGVGFVLRSLPDNAKNLYRVLLAEILTVLADGIPSLDDEGDIEDQDQVSDAEAITRRPSHKQGSSEGEVGIPYSTLYERASEEFICSSEMSFRTLLKEFHDHQMIISRKDGAGTEILGVPLSKEDCEAVLEELVLAT
ncbi:putative origin recognition complex subunit [Phaeomoniella chlamydospora]|uniref:Origin recognition complex subunit 2 n=1 Tax=Phaeomoniella chlamydospora TaxID=158046 RepID=A0A0G2E868_PHACM|nr:putative origin recognition complex subunit [Phaeomoniella chlamydospora]